MALSPEVVETLASLKKTVEKEWVENQQKRRRQEEMSDDDDDEELEHWMADPRNFGPDWDDES